MSQTHTVGGRFQIQAHIGQGGMGDVYRGLDMQTGEPVAIKSLKPEIIQDNPELVQRFQREGEALRKLNHPNIVKMLAAVEDNEQHYLVMEYVSGGSLRDLLEEQPQLPIQRVLEIALDLADALTRAHRLNIIHRDIKPANVLLAEDGTPRLTDFGVAQIGDRSHVTQSGSLIGTYAYMSPEACMSEELDARTDIWSFGVMLYEMLAGVRPFEGGQVAVVLTAILSKPAPDLTQYRADAPPALLGLVYAMLEKNREKRIGSARLVGAQLEAFIKGTNTAVDRMSRLFNDPEQTPIATGIHAASEAPTAPDDGPTITTPPPPGSASQPARSRTTPPPTPAHTPHLDTLTPIKQVVGAPRIFLSYRRDDSIAITGRIYDRLAAAFGDHYVFKDVDDIPPGANFKAMLEREVTACDVLLAIIGDRWLDVADQEGHRRLDDPHDFVRIEINAALSRPDLLMVPVLVNNARMPGVDNLPPDLSDLAFRNAAVVRNDPDFNRDMSWLIEQVRNKFEVIPAGPAPRAPTSRRWLPLGLVAALILGVIAVVLALSRPGASPATPTTAPASANASVSIPTVEPVPAGEYMVLVAEIAPTGGVKRDVTGSVVNDLKQHFEEDVPFSKIQVRRYAAPITSDAEARQVAESVGAAIVVWGTYDERSVQLEVQAGSLKLFKYNPFPREEVEKLTNVHVRMNDERAESTVFPILSSLQALSVTNSDGLAIARITAVGGLLNVKSAEVQGNSLAARWSRVVTLYQTSQLDAAIKEADTLIELNDRNPILYLGRSVTRQKLGQLDAASDDLHTSQDTGPKNWAMPAFALGNDALFLRNKLASAVSFYDQALQVKPDDPLTYTTRGAAYYALGQYDRANADMTRSIELGSDFNATYFFAVALHLRAGRFAEAQALFQTVRSKFPNPTFTQRILDAVYGSSGTNNLYTMIAKAFGSLTLRQWREVIGVVDGAQQAGVKPTSDLYFMQGFAYCNLKDYPAAEAAYSKALELEPSLTLVYATRAEVRLKQNKVLEAAADGAQVLQSQAGAAFAPYVPLIQSGKLSCENFFNFDFSTVLTPGAATTAVAAAARAPTPAPPVVATSEATAPVIQAGKPGEYLVLVAAFEPNGGQRDVTRFIARDLQQKLETDVPFSKLRVRTTPQVIRSDDEARAAAEAAGAAVVVWGGYTADQITVEVQVGSTAPFPAIKIDRKILERSANIAFNISDPRRQSVVSPVMGVLVVLQTANGGGLEMTRALAVLDQLKPDLLAITGSSVAAHVHRQVQFYFSDEEAALAALTAAIGLDTSNPLLYAWRFGVNLRLGRFDEALRDINTAERLGPAGWAAPAYFRTQLLFLKNDLAGAIGDASRAIELRPDDWFAWNWRGALYYLQGKYDLAKQDYQRSMALKPDTNFPYVLSALIALREGRMADARGYFDTVLTTFPDPAFANRLIRAAFGDKTDALWGPLFAAVGSLILGQYDQMATDIQAALKINPKLSDLYALEGFAYCNLGKYAEAEASYSRAIEMEPNIPVTYALRGDVRLKQLKLLEANADAARARDLISKSGQGDELLAYLDAGLKGEVGCQNFLRWQP
jgi:serine/threonine protein kinase/tetratricopeptide (TPR) repeat protein